MERLGGHRHHPVGSLAAEERISIGARSARCGRDEPLLVAAAECAGTFWRAERPAAPSAEPWLHRSIDRSIPSVLTHYSHLRDYLLRVRSGECCASATRRITMSSVASDVPRPACQKQPAHCCTTDSDVRRQNGSVRPDAIHTVEQQQQPEANRRQRLLLRSATSEWRDARRPEPPERSVRRSCSADWAAAWGSCRHRLGRITLAHLTAAWLGLAFTFMHGHERAARGRGQPSLTCQFTLSCRSMCRPDCGAGDPPAYDTILAQVRRRNSDWRCTADAKRSPFRHTFVGALVCLARWHVPIAKRVANA